MHARPFTSVLVANRGEIALRIIREARNAGLRSVAVYADADSSAQHVAEADSAIHIGPSPAAQSYLDGARIIAAAQESGAEAIHPGYGFLAENAGFAEAVTQAGLVWIGPSPAAIRAMGDKGNAKEIARKAGVPVIPGYDGDDQSDARLLDEARRIGWPVLIKAALGGGGRGQRRVTSEAGFAGALAAARRESLSAFASDRMILEKALDGVRHIEVQVFGDAHGNVIHLGERDCSVQRRNQKIIEEAPAPFVGEALRARMGEAAVSLARAVGYANAGTVEYLLDQAGNFWFLEMNTRIQVEHPVTEEVTGTNLIQWQFDVAQGRKLPLAQQDVRITGHAIEARLCAEDPGDDFRPQTGTARFAPADWLCRVDPAGDGDITISGHYDSMVAKVIARGDDRAGALAALERALALTQFNAVRSNRNLLRWITAHAGFTKGGVPITWLSGLLPWKETPLQEAHGAAAALVLAHGAGNEWRSTGAPRTIIRLRDRHAEQAFVVEDGRTGPWRAGTITRDDEGNAFLQLHGTGGPALRVDASLGDGTIHVNIDGTDALFEDVTYAPAERKDAAGAGAIRAPMAGRIVKVAATPGAAVAKGDILVILEAMKMEHELRAATDGIVDTVTITQGDQVAIRQLLVTLKP